MPLILSKTSPVLTNALSRPSHILGLRIARSHSSVTHQHILLPPAAIHTHRRRSSAYGFLSSHTQNSPFSTSSPNMAPTEPVDTSAIKAHRPIVISGPSGSGKSTILKRLFEEYPDKFGFSVSHTTRNPREGEKHGEHYYFVPQEEFVDLIEKKGFIEHAQFGGNRYGTSIKAVEDIAEKGRICILDIEMEGVKQVANHPTFPRPRFLFLSPPSKEVLEQRLRGRGTDKEEAILKRLKQAEVEMDFAKSPEAPHDKTVVNDDLEKAYQDVKEFIVGKDA